MRPVSFALAGVILLIAPTALAVPAIGTLHLEGTWQLPDRSVLAVEALGLYVSDAVAVRGLSGSAASADVTILRSTSVSAGAVELTPNVEATTYRVTNLTFALAAEPEAGWIGVYFQQGYGDVKLDARSSIRGTSAAEGSNYGNGAQGTVAPPAPERRAYSIVATDVHLAVEAAGVLTVRHNFAIKFQGPDLTLDAAENSSRIVTGRVQQPGAAIVEDTWAFVEFQNAELTIDSRAPFLLPSAVVEGDWSGLMRGEISSGGLETNSHRYVATEEDAVIDGAFHGRFAAFSPTTTRAEMVGELHATDLVSAARVAVPGEAVGATWLIVLASVMAAGIAMVVAVGVNRSRVGTRVSSVEECMHRVGLAVEAGDYDEALSWCREGLRFAPTSSRLVSDQGHFLEQLGDYDAALASYRQASDLSSDGEPEFLAFLLSRRIGSSEDADHWLEAALAKSPSLVLEIEEMGFIPTSQTAKHAIRRAYRALDKGGA